MNPTIKRFLQFGTVAAVPNFFYHLTNTAKRDILLDKGVLLSSCMPDKCGVIQNPSRLVPGGVFVICDYHYDQKSHGMLIDEESHLNMIPLSKQGQHKYCIFRTGLYR